MPSCTQTFMCFLLWEDANQCSVQQSLSNQQSSENLPVIINIQEEMQISCWLCITVPLSTVSYKTGEDWKTDWKSAALKMLKKCHFHTDCVWNHPFWYSKWMLFKKIKINIIVWREISLNNGDKYVFHDQQIKTRFTNVYDNFWVIYGIKN